MRRPRPRPPRPRRTPNTDHGWRTIALLAPAALSSLTTTFTRPAERNRAFAVYGAVAGAGGAIGLLLGGLLTEYLNWRWTLFINLVIAAVALLGALAYVPNPRPEGRPTLDLPGTALACSGLFLLVLGFSRAEENGWISPQSWVSLFVGAILLVAFVGWQRRATHPLLPLRVPGERNRGASYLAMFVTGAGMFGMFLFLTYYMQVILGYSPVATIGLLPRIGPRPTAAANHAKGKTPSALVTAQANLHSYATAYRWSAAFFAVGMVVCFLLYRWGAPKDAPEAQGTVHM